jgi:outer membrane protein assembly factor BamB
VLLWRTTVAAPGSPPPGEIEVMEDTGYAAPTPATDGERVHAFFATADLVTLDRDGTVLWARNLGTPDNLYGIATSLLFAGDRLIVQFDQGRDPEEGLSVLLALDGRTGTTLWQTPRPVDNSWSTPVLVETDAGLELVTSGDPWVISYDPARGTERWRAQGLRGDVAPSPVVAGGFCVVTNEYATLLAIRLGGTGDVTATHIAWTATDDLSDAPCPVSDGTLLLQVHSSGVVTCYDLVTGELQWDLGELPDGSSIWASPVLVGGDVFLFTEEGTTFRLPLTRSAPEPELVGQLGENVYGSPAYGDGCIYVRGETHLFCIGDDREDR